MKRMKITVYAKSENYAKENKELRDAMKAK